ncbi:MAG: hypothetical protein ACREMV_11825 [Gemmatimonadales bacterium]
MARKPRVSWITVVVLGALTAASCELFSEPGLQNVSLQYIGCTRLPPDSTAAFQVIVRVGGVVIPEPPFDITSSNTAVLVVVPSGDSIRSLNQNGTPTLTVRYLTSWATDSAPTLTQEIQVNPGGGGGGCT